jgi:hypothetical protein
MWHHRCGTRGLGRGEELPDPVLTGYAAVEAYLPSRRIAIAVVDTSTPEYFTDPSTAANPSNVLFQKIGAYLVPGEAPPSL